MTAKENMGRKIEVTQFTAEEFNRWAGTTPRPEFVKESKTRAFRLFEEKKKDLDGVVRVRVLSETDKPEELEFIYEHRRGYFAEKKDPAPVKVEDTQKQRPRGTDKPIGIVIQNVKDLIISELHKAGALLKGVVEEPYTAIDLLVRGVSNADISNQEAMVQLRSVLMLVFMDLGPDPRDSEETAEKKNQAFSHLDLALGLLIVAFRRRPLLDKGELQMLSNRILRPKGQPQKRPVPQQKPSPTA